MLGTTDQNIIVFVFRFLEYARTSGGIYALHLVVVSLIVVGEIAVEDVILVTPSAGVVVISSRLPVVDTAMGVEDTISRMVVSEILGVVVSPNGNYNMVKKMKFIRSNIWIMYINIIKFSNKITTAILNQEMDIEPLQPKYLI